MQIYSIYIDIRIGKGVYIFEKLELLNGVFLVGQLHLSLINNRAATNWLFDRKRINPQIFW